MILAAKRTSFLHFSRPVIGPEEINEVVETLKSGWITTGPRTEKFEKDFAAYVGAKYAVALNSCTAGLHLSLVVLGIGPGDEVIVPSLTFGATANVVEHVGARPIFADIDPVTLCLERDWLAGRSTGSRCPRGATARGRCAPCTPTSIRTLWSL